MLFHVHDGQCASVVVLDRRNTIKGSREIEKAVEKLVLNGAKRRNFVSSWEGCRGDT